MKKILTVLFTISFMTGYAQTEPQIKKALATPDKCICIELILLAESTPELQDEENKDSDSVWAKYWECPELGIDFTISHLTSNCFSAYMNDANRPIDSIIFIESWDPEDEMYLNELMETDDIYLSETCFQDLGCGGTGTKVQQTVPSLIQIYPIPANKFIKMVVDYGEIQEIVLRDIKGAVIILPFDYDGTEAILNTSSLRNGVYFCTLRTDQSIHTTRIIVFHE